MPTQLFPLEIWPQQITQASVPANNNSLRVEILEKPALDFLSTPPGSPGERDLYILGPSPTGDWSGMAEGNVVIYLSGIWIEFSAYEGWIKYVDGNSYQFKGGSWEAFGGSSNLVDSISAVFDGGGVQLGTGLRVDVVVPYACEVDSYTLLGLPSGSVSVSVHKASYADWPDTETAMATGGTGPAVVGSNKSTGDTNSWSETTINAGDILIFRVQSASTTTRAVLNLSVTRT